MSLKKQIHFSSDMGRMGNQMFQYACAKALSDQGFYTSLSHLDKMDYFILAPFERINNRIKSFLFFRVWKAMWGIRNINTRLDCLRKSYLNELKSIEGPTTVWGFFQSPEYFISSAANIKRYFTVRKKYTHSLHSFFKKHNIAGGKYIAVHLRRTDYKGFTVPGLQGDDFTLPVNYYRLALQKLSNPEQFPVVFVSDDPSAIPSLFPEIPGMIISDNDPITDFLILQNAAQLIVSNSTFAWWAAFLNDFAEDKVYCPQFFLGFKESVEVPGTYLPVSLESNQFLERI